MHPLRKIALGLGCCALLLALPFDLLSQDTADSMQIRQDSLQNLRLDRLDRLHVQNREQIRKLESQWQESERRLDSLKEQKEALQIRQDFLEEENREQARQVTDLRKELQISEEEQIASRKKLVLILWVSGIFLFLLLLFSFFYLFVYNKKTRNMLIKLRNRQKQLRSRLKQLRGRQKQLRNRLKQLRGRQKQLRSNQKQLRSRQKKFGDRQVVIREELSIRDDDIRNELEISSNRLQEELKTGMKDNRKRMRKWLSRYLKATKGKKKTN